MYMYVLYWDPNDYPNKWVLRGWSCEPTGPIPALTPLAVEDTREAALEYLPSPGLFKLERSPEDEAQIMEIWL